MPKVLFRLVAALFFCIALLAETAASQTVISQRVPGQEDTVIVCWSIPDESTGSLSQIFVLQTGNDGSTRTLWQSALGNSYSPQIHFIEEIKVNGLALALVERQTGAASSQLDVIGRTAGRVERILEIDGFKFEVEHFGGDELPYVVAHTDASILDVPEIYKWNGTRFVEDSASHPDYYRRLLAEDKSSLSEDVSGIVLVNLSRIAVLSGDRTAAKTILTDALAKERSKGDAADEETRAIIIKALRAVVASRVPKEPHRTSTPGHIAVTVTVPNE